MNERLIVNYGPEERGFTEAKCIQRVHLQYCRIIFDVKTQAQTDFIYGELGRTSLQQYRINSIIRYWLKIICCDQTYIKVVYNSLCEKLDK